MRRNLKPIKRLGSDRVKWWEIPGKTCVGAWDAKNAADYNDSLMDLSGTADLTTGVAPGIGTDGWIFTGSEYLISSLIPGNNFSSGFVQFSDISGIGSLVGVKSSQFNVSRWIIWPISISGNARFDRGVSELSDTLPYIYGNAGIASTGYYNGSPIGTLGTATNITAPLYIGAKNQEGTPQNFVTGKIQRIACYSGSFLTQTQISQLVSRMANPL